MPCCQPRKTCLMADFCPVWAWKRAGSPVIPSRTFATSGRAPAPGASASSTTATAMSRFIGRERSAFTTFAESNLLIGWKVVDREPAELGDIVRGSRLARGNPSVPVEVERGRGVLGAAVAVCPRAGELRAARSRRRPPRAALAVTRRVALRPLSRKPPGRSHFPASGSNLRRASRIRPSSPVTRALTVGSGPA